MIEIQPACPADVPQILQFIHELARFEHLEQHVRATVTDLETALFGPRPCAEVLLARLDGAPVGFALFFPNFSTFNGRAGIHLEDLYVTAHARGRGVGRALLQALARIAVARQCVRIDWEVLAWNERALEFYRALGAQALDDWRLLRLGGAALARLGEDLNAR